MMTELFYSILYHRQDKIDDISWSVWFKVGDDTHSSEPLILLHDITFSCLHMD